MKFFISAFNYEQARFKASQLNLIRSEWVYVPMDGSDRFMILAGHHNIPQQNLIGYSTEQENWYLTH